MLLEWQMKKFRIVGMSCAACVARVEKSVKSVPGVVSCSASLLTNGMVVGGNFDSSNVIAAVRNAGYEAFPETNSPPQAEAEEMDALCDRTSSALLKRFVFSVLFLIVLLYFSMGSPLFGFPLPAFFENNFRASGFVQMVLAAVVLAINRKFFESGIRALFRGGPNMDTLVFLGAGASFVYSLAMLFAGKSLYFETSAMIVTLITLGKFLESVSKGRTTDALKSLMKLSPKRATLILDGREEVVEVSRVKVGDVFIVKPGESIPVDGVVLEGFSAVDESALSGESVPVDKTANSPVSAATLNGNGSLKCRALRVGNDTTLSKIIQMVGDASATKAPIEKIADKVSGIFVPAVILVSLVTFFVWMFLGADLAFALSHAVAVLVVSCPCALGLATPVAIMVGTGKGAKNGILFKTAASLEETGRIRIVALDKTGTITRGKPVVTDIVSEKLSRDEFLKLAAAVEIRSEHPLSKAILAKARELSIEIAEPEFFVARAGFGVEAVVSGKKLFAGNVKFIRSVLGNNLCVTSDLEKFSAEGKTPILFADENSVLGVVAVADEVKDDSARAISALRKMGIHTVMLSGDNEKTALSVSKKVGVDEVVAEILPAEKANEIRRLQKRGKVAMVGDGINDAPALAVANVGMAIGAGTDVAVDAADVVLVNNRIGDVCAAIGLSRATLWNIRENLFWAFFYNVALMPLAAGAYYSINGWSMHPVLGACAMSLSSLCVVTNALRLNFKQIHLKNGEVKMSENELTFRVEGMMCAHCEAHVREALSAIPGIENVSADSRTGNVKVAFSAKPSEESLKEAVRKAGYKYKG